MFQEKIQNLPHQLIKKKKKEKIPKGNHKRETKAVFKCQTEFEKKKKKLLVFWSWIKE